MSIKKSKRKLSYTATLKSMTKEDWENTFKLKILEFIRKVYHIPREKRDEEDTEHQEKQLKSPKGTFALSSGSNKKNKPNKQSIL